MNLQNTRARGGRGVRTPGVAALLVLSLAVVAARTGPERVSSNPTLKEFQHGQRELFELVSDVERRARNYSQDDLLARIGAGELNGFYYHFDRAMPSAVSAAVSGRPSDEGVLESLDFSSGTTHPPVMQPVHGPFAVNDGVLVIENWKSDDYLRTTEILDIPISELGEFELRLKVDRGTRLELRFTTVAGVEWDALKGERPAHQRGIATLPVIPDGKFHTYRILAEGMVGRKSRQKIQRSSLKSLYLRPTEVDGDAVEVAGLRILSKRARYTRAPFGSTSVSLGREHRRVVYVNSPLDLEYSVELPAGNTTLEFGTGVLMDDDPVTFEVEHQCQTAPPTTIYSGVVENASTWSDVRLTVGPCAEGLAVFRFRTSSEDGNVAFWSNPEVYGAPRRKFNVVLVLEDTLRADHMSCYGYSRSTTPFKERLFGSGATFERSFSQATKTRPSVPSIMTSLYPTATGVWLLSDRLDDAYLTLAEIMRSRGFATTAFIQNGNAGPLAGVHQGFCQVRGTGKPTPDRGYGDGIRDWISAHLERNFFLYLHILDPHGRYLPPAEFRSWWRSVGQRGTSVAFDRRFDPEWDSAPTIEGRRARYDGEIRNNDHYFEAFVSLLEKNGLMKNTLLVFISDHGEFLGEHGLWEHKPPGHIEVLHVPLLMRYPPEINPGARSPARGNRPSTTTSMSSSSSESLVTSTEGPNRLQSRGERKIEDPEHAVDRDLQVLVRFAPVLEKPLTVNRRCGEASLVVLR